MEEKIFFEEIKPLIEDYMDYMIYVIQPQKEQYNQHDKKAKTINIKYVTDKEKELIDALSLGKVQVVGEYYDMTEEMRKDLIDRLNIAIKDTEQKKRSEIAERVNTFINDKRAIMVEDIAQKEQELQAKKEDIDKVLESKQQKIDARYNEIANERLAMQREIEERRNAKLQEIEEKRKERNKILKTKLDAYAIRKNIEAVFGKQDAVYVAADEKTKQLLKESKAVCKEFDALKKELKTIDSDSVRELNEFDEKSNKEIEELNQEYLLLRGNYSYINDDEKELEHAKNELSEFEAIYSSINFENAGGIDKLAQVIKEQEEKMSEAESNKKVQQEQENEDIFKKVEKIFDSIEEEYEPEVQESKNEETNGEETNNKQKPEITRLKPEDIEVTPPKRILTMDDLNVKKEDVSEEDLIKQRIQERKDRLDEIKKKGEKRIEYLKRAIKNSNNPRYNKPEEEVLKNDKQLKAYLREAKRLSMAIIKDESILNGKKLDAKSEQPEAKPKSKQQSNQQSNQQAKLKPETKQQSNQQAKPVQQLEKIDYMIVEGIQSRCNDYFEYITKGYEGLYIDSINDAIKSNMINRIYKEVQESHNYDIDKLLEKYYEKADIVKAYKIYAKNPKLTDEDKSQIEEVIAKLENRKQSIVETKEEVLQMIKRAENPLQLKNKETTEQSHEELTISNIIIDTNSVKISYNRSTQYEGTIEVLPKGLKKTFKMNTQAKIDKIKEFGTLSKDADMEIINWMDPRIIVALSTAESYGISISDIVEKFNMYYKALEVNNEGKSVNPKFVENMRKILQYNTQGLNGLRGFIKKYITQRKQYEQFKNYAKDAYTYGYADIIGKPKALFEKDKKTNSRHKKIKAFAKFREKYELRNERKYQQQKELAEQYNQAADKLSMVEPVTTDKEEK